MADTSPSTGFLKRIFGKKPKDIELESESGTIDPALDPRHPKIKKEIMKQFGKGMGEGVNSLRSKGLLSKR